MTQKSGSNLRPYFPYYHADFVGSTTRMSPACRWHFIALLGEQWINGDVPIDDPETIDRISPGASEFIKQLAPRFPGGMSPRLEKIRAGMIEANERRVAAGRKGAAARYGHVQDTPDDADPEQDGSIATSNRTSNADSNASSNRIAPIPIPIPIPKQKQISRSKPERVSGPISEPMWDAFRAIYPDRGGTQGWSKAKAKAAKLIASGIDWADIMNGARRYRDQQQAAGKIGTEFIKRAEYFLSADAALWTEDYPIAAASERTSKNMQAVRSFVDAGK